MGQFSISSIVGAVSSFSAIEEGSHETKSSSSDNKAAIGRGATSSTRERHDVREKERRKDVGVKGKEEADSSLGRSLGQCCRRKALATCWRRQRGQSHVSADNV